MQYTQEEVARFFEEHGCTLLSQYKNVKSPLRFIARCGHEAQTCSFEAARRPTCSFLCAECSPKKTYTDEEVAELVTEAGCELLEITTERHKNHRWYKTIRIVCTCGHEYTLPFEKFVIGRGRLCPSCSRPKGERHHAWNSALTDEERATNRDVFENVQWRRSVYERDAFVCQRCGSAHGSNLVAHHLNGWADFPEQRFVLDNGVTLCDSCHLRFHRTYGFGHNTKEQYIAWLAGDNTEVITETKESVTP